MNFTRSTPFSISVALGYGRDTYESGASVQASAFSQWPETTGLAAIGDPTLVRIRVEQTEGLLGNGFGVVCRADEQGNGYYFLLSSEGQFTISVGTSARDELFELIPWQYHSIIRQNTQSNDESSTWGMDRASA